MYGVILMMSLAAPSAAIAQTSDYDFGSWIPLDSPHYWSARSVAGVVLIPHTPPSGTLDGTWTRPGVQYVTAYYSPPASTPQYSSSSYLARDALDGPANATLVVRLPASARLMVGGVLTRATGATRQFVSPPLGRGKSYVYVIRAEVVRDGVVRSATRTVIVRPGRRYDISLLLPAPRTIPPRRPEMRRAIPGL